MSPCVVELSEAICVVRGKVRDGRQGSCAEVEVPFCDSQKSMNDRSGVRVLVVRTSTRQLRSEVKFGFMDQLPP
jgi:hypothetical protein